MKTKDIRSERTKRAIVFAVLDLLENKTFRKITVNDICEAAYVCRTTFYMHFDDKYQLLVHYMQTELDKAINQSDPEDLESFYHHMLTSIYNNRQVYWNLVRDSNAELDSQTQKIFANRMRGFLDTQPIVQNSCNVPVDIVNRYLTKGVLGVLDWWIRSKCEMPIPQLQKHLACIHRFELFSPQEHMAN